MGSIICTAGFPSAAIASNCFTARCVSIWYGFFIATLSFFLGRKLPEGYHAFGLRVATFYDLPGIPIKVTAVLVAILAACMLYEQRTQFNVFNLISTYYVTP